MNIPFVDLRQQIEFFGEELNSVIKRVVSGGIFVGGEEVAIFENTFAERYHVPNCIGTGNGTDSLFLILKSLGIGLGDEVITPAFSCMPTAEVISLAGGQVVFCDVDPLYYTIDPEKVKELITSKTRAVIAVHLFGQAARVDELKRICEKHNLWLIEDCAQAHLTKLDDQLVGTFGAAAAFSFYPTKNLGALGDAGCVITSDSHRSEKIRRLANHGALKKDDHKIEGLNSRLDTMQASILQLKLKYLDGFTKKRRINAAQYNNLLDEIGDVAIPLEMPDSFHSYHIYAIRTKKRDQLKVHLENEGIGTMIHYPQPLPATQAYQHLGKNAEDFPNSYMLSQEILSLPIYPELTTSQITRVSDAIKKFF